MTEDIARQVAALLNLQNRRVVDLTPADILVDADRYIVRADDGGQVIGVVDARPVQWYQCEIEHLSVAPGAKRQGVATALMSAAEDRARQCGASVAQCTIRVGNRESEGLARKCGYVPTVTFINPINGHVLSVYQKVL